MTEIFTNAFVCAQQDTAYVKNEVLLYHININEDNGIFVTVGGSTLAEDKEYVIYII